MNTEHTKSNEDLIPIILESIAGIANERDVDRLLVRMADMGRDLVGAESCTLWMLDAKAGELWSRVSHELGEIRIPLDRGIAGHVARWGEPEIINDPYGDERFDQQVDKQTGRMTRNILALPVRDSSGDIIGVFQAVNKIRGDNVFTREDLEYFLIAATYIGKQIESVLLQEEIENTQREIIFTLAETAELRSKETGYHVKRVAEYSYLLATLSGMTETEAEILKLASPLHDIGKIAIPDAILLKPGRLTEAEIMVMKTHTQLGYDMLKHSGRRLIKTAAIVALEHHEKWDGNGYPRGLAGEDIHIYGRITAVADVFDALSVSRVYKDAWPLEKIIAVFKEERGRHFDPHLVDLFLDNMDRVMEIFEEYQDHPPEGSARDAIQAD
ncbi:MAG: HD domain-containing protein [Desulfobacterales bacterium]|nr:HD domain-containing protein [Desulfobacterales bacterium]